MIEESYVSFETAKILKEAGFRELTKTHYSNSGQIWETAMPADYNDDFNCNTCNRPTQSLAARWLREVHNIHVFAFFDYVERNWIYCIADLDAVTAEAGMEMSESNYPTYEEAMEDALQEAIKLIKK